jgi:hypothetical protein
MFGEMAQSARTFYWMVATSMSITVMRLSHIFAMSLAIVCAAKKYGNPITQHTTSWFKSLPAFAHLQTQLTSGEHSPTLSAIVDTKMTLLDVRRQNL